MHDKRQNPYNDLCGGRWLRGNLHNHPRPLDNPSSICTRYAQFGYGFLALTEHDRTWTHGEIAEWDRCGMVLLPGNEVSKNGCHILHVGANCHVEPLEDRQTVIDQINADGGFAVLNHPNGGVRHSHNPIEQLEALQGYLGIEIYNAGGIKGKGSPLATDKWDMLLTAGRRVWGFASDDYHRPADAGRAWIVGYARDRTVDGVMEMLRAGRFYCSTGVTIDEIEVDGHYIRVRATNAGRIAAWREGSAGVAVTDGSSLEVHVPDTALYVRFECYGDAGRSAWTQPIFFGEA